MTNFAQTPNFEGWRAIILHRPHDTVRAISRQLEQLGIRADAAWPDLGAEPADANLVFFDADHGHESQFCWAPGAAPIPTIALVGSEAPGRVSWALAQGADAHLLKPIGSGGIYSAILIATKAFAERHALVGELRQLRDRLAARECLAAATAHLMQREQVSAEEAYRLLRRLAMQERRTIEEMAELVLRRPHEKRAQDEGAR